MGDCTGSTVVVTGANSGIGKEVTREFTRRGARVIAACRSLDRGESAAAEIREELPAASIAVSELDLADLDSVRAFTEPIDDPIDVLCNNAGVMATPRRETADGFELQFGVNHLGHFALTGLLLENLQAAPSPRVVTQSSAIHERGTIDFEDLHGEDSYDKWQAYAQSKLANVLFAYELDRRTDVDGIACHPGYADTNLQFRGPEMAGSRLRLLGMKVANTLFGQPPEDGALPMLYAATSPEVGGGDYVGPSGLLNARGPPEKQRSAEQTYDADLAGRLWERSIELTGVSYDGE